MEHTSDTDNLNPTDNSSENDFWADLPNHVKRSIETAKQQLDNGEGIPHRQVMNEVKAVYFNK